MLNDLKQQVTNQGKAIAEIVDDYAKNTAEHEKLEEARAEIEAKINRQIAEIRLNAQKEIMAAVVSESQAQRMIGEAFEFEETERAPRGFGGNRGGGERERGGRARRRPSSDDSEDDDDQDEGRNRRRRRR